VRTLTRKVAETATSAAYLYRELLASALTLVPGRSAH
jgi:hypothetical protein